MIRHLSHQEIDRAKWDQCVRQHTDLIYPYSWWLDIVAPDWEALVEGDYQAVMPLTCRSKAGLRYLFQPAFTQQLGVFGQEDASSFLAGIPQAFKLVEISLNEKNKAEGESSHNHLLDLSHPYEQLKKAYSENTTRNLKKASQQPFVFSDKIKTEELLELYRKNQGAKHVQLKKGEDAILTSLINESRTRKCGITVGIRDPEGKLLTAAFFVWTERRVIFLFSATDLSEKTRWLPLLIDQCIEHDAGKDRVLDFEGSNDPELARFYKGFGAKEVVYLRIRKNKLPFWIKWMK